MAIRIVEGVLGGGKTYYVVHHLLQNYYVEDRGIFVLKKDTALFCNIRGFKPQHFQLDEFASKYGGYDKFFTEKVQEEIRKQYGSTIYVIDEAQKIFRKNYKVDAVFDFFETSRHDGTDFYLITQNIKKLPFDITSLAEYSIYAVPRMRSLMGEFRYKLLDGDVIVGSETLRRKDWVFNQYKSFKSKELEKIKNPLLRGVIKTLVFIALLWVGADQFMFRDSEEKLSPSSAIASETVAASAPSSPAPVSVSSAAPPVPVVVNWVKANYVKSCAGGVCGVLVVFDNELIPLQALPVEYQFRGRWLYIKADLPPDVDSSEPFQDSANGQEVSQVSS